MYKFLKPIAIAGLAAMSTAACSSNKEDENIIDRPEFTSADGIFTIDALEAMGRVGEPKLSPDGSKVLYSVSYESVEQNRSNADLYLMDADGQNKTRLTRTAKSESNYCWIDGGKKIAFLYPDTDGKQQIWVMNPDGSGRKQISKEEKDVNGFLFSPDEKKVVMIQSIKWVRTAQDVYPDLPDATGRIIDDMMYKHWDEWVTEIPHPFIADFDGSGLANQSDIMADEPLYEAPMKPFGGIESFAWTPDSKKLAYVSRKKSGMEYALSTNSDIFLYDLESKQTSNLTDGMMGYDTAPTFSPDGTMMAFLSMEHDGYESDKNRIMVRDMATGEISDLTANWDYTVDEIAWQPNSRGLFFLAYRDGVKPIFNILLDGTVSLISGGEVDYQSLQPVNNSEVLTMAHSMVFPNEIYRTEGGSAHKLTGVNDDIFAQIQMPSVERRIVKTTDGKDMLTWIVKPQNFDPNAKYPALLYCQGGPQQAVSQFWSFRWNLALMAANGYVVIAPNRRGLPGFGTEWNAQISGDYGGQNMRDYFAAVDDVKTEPWVNEKKIGAVGASYGGFSVYWLAGHHEGRFAALIAHAGIFNIEAQYLETEEMWFANWDMGGGAVNAPTDTKDNPDYGAYWNKSNAIAQATFATSPHKFVDQWTTPILITHGELDYRILSSQGEMAFNAAKLRGVPAEMLIFPDENHWILKPQNAILWQRVFFRWLDKWLK
ncbi:MAG: S9 family peptidase [Muribaculaceae bacterium]|nr:S9 family peptidase [Muribaculaceae bacterium]